MKRNLILAGVLVLIIGQLAYTKTDPNIERLVKVAKQKQKESEEAAKRQEIIDTLSEEPETDATEINSNDKAAELRKSEQEAKRAREAEERKAAADAKKAELEAKKAKQAEKRKKESEAKIMKEKYKNMSESEKMDAEIQRIKKRVEEINASIEEYKLKDQMLEKMYNKLVEIESRTK